MSFFQARYRIKGLYFIDEPETALSPRLQLELVELLLKAQDEGHAQFIIATHSPILMAFPGAVTLNFDGEKIEPVSYEDIEHVRITKTFLENPERYLKALFEE